MISCCWLSRQAFETGPCAGAADPCQASFLGGSNSGQTVRIKIIIVEGDLVVAAALQQSEGGAEFSDIVPQACGAIVAEQSSLVRG